MTGPATQLSPHWWTQGRKTADLQQPSPRFGPGRLCFTCIGCRFGNNSLPRDQPLGGTHTRPLHVEVSGHRRRIVGPVGRPICLTCMRRGLLTRHILLLACHAGRRSSIEPKVNLHVDLHRHRNTVFAGGLETPATNRFDCLLIKAHSECPLNANLLRVSVRPHDEP